MDLNGVQKSALLLISMDLKETISVLKNFTDLEIKLLLDTIIAFDNDIFKYSDIIVHEFYDTLRKNKIFNFDANTRILKILAKTIGEDKSHRLLKDSLLQRSFLYNISMLELLSAKDIFVLLQQENLYIVSAVLTYIKDNLSIQILALFHKNLRDDILQALGNFSGLNYSGFFELNKIISGFLYQHDFISVEEKRINKISKILFTFESNNIIQLVRKIKTSCPFLVKKVISRYFQLQHIACMSNDDVKFIINNVDICQIYILLKHMHKEVKNKFISNMSPAEYKGFQKYFLKDRKITFAKIYLQKNLLLTKIKNFIRNGKIFRDK